MNKALREQIRIKFGGRCAYCGCELQKGWHVDHLEPIVRNFKYNSEKSKYENDGTCMKPENENIDNLNPACASCNIQKHSFSIEEFRKNIAYFITSLNLYSNQYKFAKRYGLVSETQKEVVFYFETVEQ